MVLPERDGTNTHPKPLFHLHYLNLVGIMREGGLSKRSLDVEGRCRDLSINSRKGDGVVTVSVF